MADVFISYHEDSAGELAERIAAALEAVGVSCWCARRDLGPGGNFALSIPPEIDACRVFLLLLTEKANGSLHIENELGLAFERLNKQRNILILPYYAEKCTLDGWLRYYLFHVQKKPLPPMDELVRQVAAALGRKPVIVQPQIWTPKHTTIAAGSDYAVALRRDGTVVAVGYNSYGECDVSGWREIVSVAASGGNIGHTAGLRSNGTAVIIGYESEIRYNTSNWQKIPTCKRCL